MREIKFRAWEKHERGGGRLIVNAPNLMLDASHGIPYWQFGFEEPKPMNDTILMQFTGHKDKNGKEIYEGDIVTGREDSFEIYWENNDIGFRARIANESFAWMLSSDCEVIGNIYENPELVDNK